MLYNLGLRLAGLRSRVAAAARVAVSPPARTYRVRLGSGRVLTVPYVLASTLAGPWLELHDARGHVHRFTAADVVEAGPRDRWTPEGCRDLSPLVYEAGL